MRMLHIRVGNGFRLSADPDPGGADLGTDPVDPGLDNGVGNGSKFTLQNLLDALGHFNHRS